MTKKEIEMVAQALADKLAKAIAGEIVEAVTDRLRLLHKDTLSLKEAAKYLDLQPGTLYKMTSRRDIAYSKPMGRKVYFKKDDLDDWLDSGHVASDSEIEEKAQEHCSRKKIVFK